MQAAADSRSKSEGHTGSTIASANITMRASSKPCRPPGVSSTTCVMPVGTRSTFFWSMVQGAMAGREGIAPAQPAAAGLLAVDVAQHHGQLLACAPGGDMGGKGALASCLPCG